MKSNYLITTFLNNLDLVLVLLTLFISSLILIKILPLARVVNMKIRGQAAMEFLMTYGWAILVVLISIGALAYFGVLSPGRLLPASCRLGPGFACGEFKVSTTDLNGTSAGTQTTLIQVRDGLGATVTNVQLTFPAIINGFTNGSATNVPCPPLADNPTTIIDGGTSTFYFTCAGIGSIGDRFKGTLSLYYTQSGQVFSHNLTGDLTTRVE